jgi:hypothetical protein
MTQTPSQLAKNMEMTTGCPRNSASRKSFPPSACQTAAESKTVGQAALGVLAGAGAGVRDIRQQARTEVFSGDWQPVKAPAKTQMRMIRGYNTSAVSAGTAARLKNLFLAKAGSRFAILPAPH